jgi:hypothetical protein
MDKKAAFLKAFYPDESVSEVKEADAPSWYFFIHYSCLIGKGQLSEKIREAKAKGSVVRESIIGNPMGNRRDRTGYDPDDPNYRQFDKDKLEYELLN